FTWYTGATSGSEAFERLSPVASCPQLAGVTTNLTGNWFAPTQPGYGVDVVALPDTQFDIFYFYDLAGAARWGRGAAPLSAARTIDMLKSSGFCPLCDRTAVSTQPLGPLTMTFSGASGGRLKADFRLNPPAVGGWNADAAMVRLTGSPACE